MRQGPGRACLRVQHLGRLVVDGRNIDRSCDRRKGRQRGAVSSTSSRDVEDGIDVVLVCMRLRMARVGMEGDWHRSIGSCVASMCAALVQILMQRGQMVVGVVACRGRHGPTVRVWMEAWNAASVMQGRSGTLPMRRGRGSAAVGTALTTERLTCADDVCGTWRDVARCARACLCGSHVLHVGNELVIQRADGAGLLRAAMRFERRSKAALVEQRGRRSKRRG